MTVPVSPALRLRGALVDRISNFGAFPPTVKLRDRHKIALLLLNHADPKATEAQMDAIESHGVLAGSWEPVPLDHASVDGVELANRVSARIGELSPRVVGLNLEALSIKQIREFLWGRLSNGIPVRGFRGKGGVIANFDGLRPGIAAYWIDEPFKDGSVKPHVDLKAARIMLSVEGFDGIMRQVDHPRAIIDRIAGFRSDGTTNLVDAYPPTQVQGCYDASLGIEIREGLYFLAETFPGIFSARRRLLNAARGLDTPSLDARLSR